MCLHPSVSLNNDKICIEISEDKKHCCETTARLRSGNFSDLNSACSKVLVPVKIFQFHDMGNENRFLGTFRGHSNGLMVMKALKNPWILLFLTSTNPSCRRGVVMKSWASVFAFLYALLILDCR